MLIRFSGRLKRKGPNDEAYEQKRLYNVAVAPRAKWCECETSARQNAGRSAAVGEADGRRKSTQMFDEPVECVAMARSSDSIKTDIQRRVVVASRAAVDDDRTRQIQTRPSHLAVDDRVPVSVDQTRLMARQSAVDPCGCVRFADQSLYRHQPARNNDNGEDVTAAYICEAAAPAAWNKQHQSRGTRHLVDCRYDVGEDYTAAHLTSTSVWPDHSRVIPPNYELFPCLPAPFHDSAMRRPSISQCCSESAVMTDDWFHTNANFDEIDRSFLASPLTLSNNRF